MSSDPHPPGRSLAGRVALGLALLLFVAGLGACAAPSPETRRTTAARIAREAGLRAVTYRVQPFSIQGYRRGATAPDHEGLHVYIEGDGLAWQTRTRASRDPTPIDPIALRLAAADTTGAEVVYLARPCQQGGAEAPPCEPLHWTEGRYGEPVVEAMEAAVSQALSESDAERAVLVGFSGGGVVAALLAARLHDVSAFVTVAAPLDPAAWASYHGVTPLTTSLQPREDAKSLCRVLQLHLVGERDEVVPREVIEPYVAALGCPQATRVVIVPGADHTGWVRLWPDLLAGEVGSLFREARRPPGGSASPI